MQERYGSIAAPSGRRFQIYSEEERTILESLGWTNFVSDWKAV